MWFKWFKKREKIKVGFFLMFPSVFSAANLFKGMLQDRRFDPFIVIIPNIMRGGNRVLELLDIEYNAACNRYSNVYKSYDDNTNEYIDFSENCDIAFLSTIYKGHTHDLYSNEYFKRKGVKTCFINYGYTVTKYGNNILNNSNLDKIFSEANIIANELRLPKEKICCLGYAKMDSLSVKHITTNSSRKKIIIAPHHSITNWGGPIHLSNFVKYSDFFLKLPILYPEVDFVYRDHPLLTYNLLTGNVWTHSRVSDYLNKMRSYHNVQISPTSEDYFDTFINSDGLIHDCGSFMAEYLFSGNPACYMINEHTRQDLNEFGNKCVDMHYQAFNEEDIIKFIDNVILKGEDPMKEKRKSFVNKELKINYPNSAKAICDYIKKELI